MDKMWILRRMIIYNLDTELICDTYIKEIRSILEMAVPVLHSGLTLERVQKVALLIILGDHYTNYDVACTLVGIEPSQMRRQQLCIKFALKNLKQENSLFKIVSNPVNTRSKTKVVIEPKANYKRFRNSSIPYLSRLVIKFS